MSNTCHEHDNNEKFFLNFTFKWYHVLKVIRLCSFDNEIVQTNGNSTVIFQVLLVLSGKIIV